MAEKLNIPQAILFDFDETLVSSQRYVHEALIKTLKEFEVYEGWTIEDIEKRSVLAAKDYFPEFFKEKTPEAIQFFRKQYIELSKTMRPLDGALQTLTIITKLSNKPYLGLVSNKQGILLRKEVEELGWSSYFDKVVGSGDTVADKPSIEPLKYALINSEIISNGDNIWFIGDSHVDIEAANKFEAISILINNKYDQHWFEPYLPKIHVKNHCELQKIILDTWREF